VAAPYEIRLFGDPVLRQRATAVTEIDGRIARLAEGMIVTMQEAPGVGLAANQVGVLKRLFVFDVGDGPRAVVNPAISDHRGEWVFEEGCLSIPGLSGEVIRPKEVHLTGVDLDGNDISVEADELLARVFQHELDHLDGVLFIDRMEPDLRKDALRAIRELTLTRPAVDEDRPGLRIPGR
jgi:peptide deformylase